MRSSSIGYSFHFMQYPILVWSPQLKFKILGRFNQWVLNYSTFSILRSSSTLGHLHFKQYSILVWSPKLKFKILGRSDQWLMINIVECDNHLNSLVFMTMSKDEFLVWIKQEGIQYIVQYTNPASTGHLKDPQFMVLRSHLLSQLSGSQNLPK